MLDTILKDQYESRMDIEPDPSMNGLEQVLARIEAFRTFAAEDPDFLRAIFVLHFEAVRGDLFLRRRVAMWLRRERQGFVNAIEVGIKDGTIRDDLDPNDSATDVMSTGIGIAYWWVTDPDGYPVDAEIRRWGSKVRLELGRHGIS